MAKETVLMEKDAAQMNVPVEKKEFYRLTGWKEVVRPVPAVVVVTEPFTLAQRKAIAEIVAAEMAHSSLSPAEKKAIIESRAAEEKAKAEVEAAEQAAVEQAEAEAKADEKKAKADEKKAKADEKKAKADEAKAKS